ncbi:MAG: EAL domain-containing protein [Burkholderiales bacterium]|nr:EAL domain-containing protein [Burkholderiales bacterium]
MNARPDDKSLGAPDRDTGAVDSGLRTVADFETLVHRTPEGHVRGQFGAFVLGSHFQPIFSLAHGRVVGHEALMRATDGSGSPVSPIDVLSSAGDFESRLALDRLSRLVHVDNFLRQAATPQWLFLNVQPDVFVRSPHIGTFFRELFRARQLSKRRVVLEVLEEAVPDEQAFREAVRFYRDQGCLLALDDFGAGHSNFDRVWNIRPDIVKLDRSMALQASRESRVRRMMPMMVSLLHEAGALVLWEGLETRDQALMAFDCDVDFVQGYWFGRPAAALTEPESQRPNFEALWDSFHGNVRLDGTRQRELIAPYANALGNASSLLAAGLSPQSACREFLELPYSRLCFMLDARGIQIGPSFEPIDTTSQNRSLFNPLSDAVGANWSHRHYFRRAIEARGRVQVSRPYLSIHGARQCVTLSICVLINGEPIVLCGDVAWRDRFVE